MMRDMRAQTNYGDIEMAFFPDVAPVTVAHILKLARLGAYNTNHFFRVRPSRPTDGARCGSNAHLRARIR